MTPTSTHDAIGDGIPDDETVEEALLRVASAARLFRLADGRFRALVGVGDRQEIHGLKSKAFRDWLITCYLGIRGVLPSDGAIGRVLSVLETRTRFLGGGAPTGFVRVGRASETCGAGCYLDIGDDSGQAVRISAQGWAVVDRPPLLLERPEGQLPLVSPLRDGSIELLRPYVNLTDPDFHLLIGWMAAALLPEGPYPILVTHGEQGSAKSTLARIVRLLIDPQA